MATSQAYGIRPPLSVQLSMNAHETAPQEIKTFFKLHTSQSADSEGALLDLTSSQVSIGPSITAAQQIKAFGAIDKSTTLTTEAQVSYRIDQIPGLTYVPGLITPSVQRELLNNLLHRDLFNPAHKTNLHSHYDIKYSKSQNSLFKCDPSDSFLPHNPSLHKPLQIQQVLDSKLRWITLGGQYNWTDKVYPAEKPPDFPIDVASLVHHLFPEMEPQAAIVNLYSPGDRLNMHRDVSEEVDKGLVSMSIGCSCIFIIGIEDANTQKVQKVAIRLNSGDAVLMTGKSRLAWHGVSRVEKGTCPDLLQDWPGKEYPEWEKWMQSKRINLNVRQMRDAELQEHDYI